MRRVKDLKLSINAVALTWTWCQEGLVDVHHSARWHLRLQQQQQQVFPWEFTMWVSCSITHSTTSDLFSNSSGENLSFSQAWRWRGQSTSHTSLCCRCQTERATVLMFAHFFQFSDQLRRSHNILLTVVLVGAAFFIKHRVRQHFTGTPRNTV